jgi:thioester reductase-like protein
VSSLSSLLFGEVNEAPVQSNDVSCCAFMSGYGSSKRVSEILVSKAHPWLRFSAIVRPGSIGGCTFNGALSPRYMVGICELQIAPSLSKTTSPISVVPVDFVASKIVDCFHALDGNYVVNIFGGAAFDANDIAAYARISTGADIKEVSWAAFVEAIPSSKTLGPLRSYFGSRFPMSLDERHAKTSLTGVPSVSKEQLLVYFEWLRKHNYC